MGGWDSLQILERNEKTYQPVTNESHSILINTNCKKVYTQGSAFILTYINLFIYTKNHKTNRVFEHLASCTRQ